MGLPDRDDYPSLGGEIQDYQPAEDGSTDLPAADDDQSRCNVAALTRTAARAYVAFTTNGTTCTVTDCDGVWPGGTLGGPNQPTVTRTGAGAYLVTWPTTITDERGVTHNLNLRRGWSNVEQVGFVSGTLAASPNTLSVAVWSLSGGAAADPTAAVVAFVL